jgi:3-hydroxyisobutyrate dehydrogenase
MRVYDLRPEVVEEFARDGAIPAQSPASLARECDVVMLCLPRSADVREAIFGPGGLAEGLSEGKVIIDQTSGDPDETRDMAATLAERGVTLVDAPVSGGPNGAEAGTIAVIAAGPKDVFERVKPIYESISPNVFYCGETGSGHVIKTVNNTIAACNRIAAFEAAAVGRKYGLSLEVMAEVINKSSGRNSTTENAFPLMIKGEPTSDFGLALMLKDVTLATQLGTKSGVPMLVSNLVRGMLQGYLNQSDKDAKMDAVQPVFEAAAKMKFVD